MVAVDSELAGKTILVIEDDEDAREMLTSLLQMYGIRVLAASSGNEGYALFERERPDIVISAHTWRVFHFDKPMQVSKLMDAIRSFVAEG